jgi:hypothetical protein
VPECYQPSKKHEAFPLPAKCKDSLKKSKLPGFISLGIRALFVPDQKRHWNEEVVQLAGLKFQFSG